MNGRNTENKGDFLRKIHKMNDGLIQQNQEQRMLYSLQRSLER